MDKVSVIVPVYNVEQFLSRCVDSIVRQTYTNIEIILVDDGSPDASPSLCDEYAKRYSNVRVIHKANGGLSSARLAGFNVAVGTYILFVDSDDYIELTMVEELVGSIKNYNADIAICSYNTIHGDKLTPAYLPYAAKNIAGNKAIIEQYILPLLGPGNKGEINIPGFTCIRLYKHELLKDDFFQSEREYFLEDHILNLLYADNVRSIAIVNKPLYNYCFNSESLSNCYRKNKWTMYENIIQWYGNYIKERSIQGSKDRLLNFMRSALCSTIDNCVNAGSYKAFLNEVRQLFTKELFVKVLKCQQFMPKLSSQNITIALLKLRAFKLLYTIRYDRLTKSR